MSLAHERFTIERLPQVTAVVSPGELLQNPSSAADIWAVQVAEHPELLTQVAERAKQGRAIDLVLEQLPARETIEFVVANEIVTERQAEAAYTALASLLRDPDYERLALYVPFELLPAAMWQPNDEYLQQAITEFKSAYMQAWEHLLYTEDVRANFVDGDVLETPLRVEDVPRVVKAAHLIPALVTRGLLSTQEVIELHAQSEESVLKQSVAESLLVLADKGYITAQQLEQCGITYESNIEPSRQVQEPAHYIAQAYANIIEQQASPLATVATENRLKWLNRKRFDDLITSAAAHIGAAIVDGDMQRVVLRRTLPIDSDAFAAQLYIESVREALEQLSVQNAEPDTMMFAHFSPDIQALLLSDNPYVAERAKKCLRHANKLGYVTNETLQQQGVTSPNLAGTASENLALMPEVVAEVQEMAQQIANDPHLSAFMLPVLSLGGSRLKGYGEQTSDIDLCVFIKPGVSYSTRRDMRDYIREFFRAHGMDEHPIEFWLDDTNSRLSVIDFKNDDQHVADSAWSHILFDTVLIGDEKEALNLVQNLLPTYFNAQQSDEFGWSPRNYYLERIEQNLLQYRLLHKGYERHYPRQSTLDDAHADAIDGNAVFWDSGYRKLATKLFVDRVFLPKI